MVLPFAYTNLLPVLESFVPIPRVAFGFAGYMIPEGSLNLTLHLFPGPLPAL
jgi:hypothetical protein